MIDLSFIELTREEGPRDACGATTVCASFDTAHRVLEAWGRTAPDPADGYHKCGFQIVWADGTEYRGCFALNRGGLDGGRNFRDSLRFRLCNFAGIMTRYGEFETRQRYMEFLDRPNVAPIRDLCRRILTICEI